MLFRSVAQPPGAGGEKVMLLSDERNKRWGPVVASRMSTRIKRDGKTVVEKAQELKKRKDLEIPKGTTCSKNSFSILDDSSLARYASIAGIVLGNDDSEIAENIECIKGVENGRLQNFHENHPDMFLPMNIDMTGKRCLGLLLLIIVVIVLMTRITLVRKVPPMRPIGLRCLVGETIVGGRLVLKLNHDWSLLES